MTGETSFWNIEVWRFVITLALLFGGMLLANLLRRDRKSTRLNSSHTS